MEHVDLYRLSYKKNHMTHKSKVRCTIHAIELVEIQEIQRRLSKLKKYMQKLGKDFPAKKKLTSLIF